MDTKKSLVIFCILLMLFVSGCSMTGLVMQDNDKITGQKEAETWILTKSPTYTFDGYNLIYEDSVKIQNCDKCYNYFFAFTCRHTGYGNRDDEELDRMTTLHHISIVTKDGKVVKANIDNEWDDLKEEETTNAEKNALEALKKENEEVSKLDPNTQKALNQKILCKTIRIKCSDYENIVCGSDGKTYQNDCLACQNEDYVIWYTLGECE